LVVEELEEHEMLLMEGKDVKEGRVVLR